MPGNRICLLLAATVSLPAAAQPMSVLPGVRAELRPVSPQIPMGQPVWIRFSIHNMGDEPVTLTVGLKSE